MTTSLDSIFEYSDYRAYLLHWISRQPRRGHGVRSRIAQAIRSPASHVSQVLKGISNLSAEQTEELNLLLGHSPDESAFMHLLVQRERAGTQRLRARIDQQLQQLRGAHLNLKRRFNVKQQLTEADQAVFYGSWIYAAAHILLTIPEFRTPERVSQALGISIRKARETLAFLVSIGLAKVEKDRFLPSVTKLHLGTDSRMLAKHHVNWRVRTLQALEQENHSESLHYSSVVSISREDVPRIKSLLVKCLEEAKAVVRVSEEQELHSFCLDFFRLV